MLVSVRDGARTGDPAPYVTRGADMKIVVTGGQGDLGRDVMAEVASRGHTATSASRRTGVDLRTGAGLRAALDGADAVVHCASSPRDPRATDIDGTRRLIEAAGPGLHIVYVSIVGVDITPFAYYHAKLAAEKLLAEAAGSSTVVRATQFHDFAAAMARRLMRGPVVLTTGSLAAQPVDRAWVASRLVDHATGVRPEGPVRATDLAGPAVLSIPEVAARLRAHEGRPAPRVLRIPPIGAAMKAFASGSILPGERVETGGETFDDWLGRQP